MTSCIFCASPHTSREHVWPQWVSKVLAEKASFRVIAEQVEVRTWALNSEDIPLVTRRVCAACNNGWMSLLETSVRPILEPMLRGIPVTVSPTDQPLLTRWVIKTAMVLEHLGANISKKFFLPAEHSAVRAGTTLPSNVYVWIARVADPSLAASAYEHDLTFRLDDHPAAPPGVGYTSTLSAGAFAFQFLCLRPHALLLPSSEPAFTNALGWEGHEQQLWPAAQPITWPPPQALDHQRLNLYATRFVPGAS